MKGMIETLNSGGAWFVPIAYSMLLQSTLLILIIAAIDYVFLRRARAVVRYTLWLLVLVKLVLPVNLSSPTSMVTITPSLEYSPPIVFEEPSIESMNLQLAETADGPSSEYVTSTQHEPPPPVRKVVLNSLGWAFLIWVVVSHS